MEWLISNWVWLALGGVFVLFLFGRAGCGMGHSGHEHGRRGADESHDPARDAAAVSPATKFGLGEQASSSAGHAHVGPTANPAALETAHAGHDDGSAQPERRRHRHGC